MCLTVPSGSTILYSTSESTFWTNILSLACRFTCHDLLGVFAAAIGSHWEALLRIEAENSEHFSDQYSLRGLCHGWPSCRARQPL